MRVLFAAGLDIEVALIGFGRFRVSPTTLKVASMLLLVIGDVGPNPDAWRSPA